MRWWQVTFLGAVSFLAGSDATFSPNVTVISCTSQRVVVQLENAAKDGLIFIQGRGTSCNRSTVAEKKSYEFDFELCNIEYDTKFRVVVQKKPKYQTGYDKVIPVMCILDTSDLFVSGVVFPEEKLDSSFVNKTVRPTVSMRILAPDSTESVNEVSLNDQVLLSLSLDDPYLEDFDIKAKNCRAEMINLVENECSKDEELFPNFERQSKGDITSAFQAFQPTNLDGQAEVDVSFTCSVAVCKGECHKKLCGQIVGWGRKRRDDDVDDDGDDGDDDDVYEKVTCATKLKVKSPEQESFLDDVTADLKGRLCAEKVAVASVMALTIFTLVVSWVVCACVTSKLRSVTRLSDGPNKPSTLRRLSEKNINFARSVGRRLSHMLNIPIGYNMRDPKMMHECIPETDPSPPAKRRDSVTVSPDTEKDSNPYVNELFMHTADKQPGFRRRFVDRSVQTDPDCSTLSHSKQDLAKPSPKNSKKHPFSFITSISIKSGLSKSRPRSESFPEPRSPICNTPFRSYTNECLPSGTVCINSTDNASVIQYSAEDVPKVRNAYNVHEGDKFDHEPQMRLQTDVNSTEDFANISLNDGYKEDIDMAPFENALKNGENETDIQSTSTIETEYDDVFIVDQVMPEPIEFVASHKRERTSSTHV